MVSIKKLHLFANHYLNKEVTLNGWVKHNRNSKNLGFLAIVDGSTIHTLQTVYKTDLSNFNQIAKLLPGSAVTIKGVALKDDRSLEPIEIVAKQIDIVSTTQSDYFLQNKKHSNEFLRIRSDLRARSTFFHSVFKIRNHLMRAVHHFFQKHNFTWLSAPLITQNDCEGGGESFSVVDSASNQKDIFFNKTAMLSVSGQLHAEAFAQSFKKIYTFGPTFRADQSNTKVHSSEFWMIEPEVAFATKNDGIKLATDMIKAILSDIYVDAYDELMFLSDVLQINLLDRIKKIIDVDFVSLTYTQAVKILNSQKQFHENPAVWGQDLNKEQETFLCQHFGFRPVFVTDYPKAFKAFYMKINDDSTTVACFDLLFPQIGEVVGGSERESDYEKLLANAKSKNIPLDKIQWYANLRLQGYGGSTGFGLGFDRLLMYISGVENIRDVIPFFSGYKNLRF